MGMESIRRTSPKAPVSEPRTKSGVIRDSGQVSSTPPRCPVWQAAGWAVLGTQRGPCLSISGDL